VLSLNEVAQAPCEGVAFYQELPGLHEYMAENGLAKEACAQDELVLRLLFEQPQVVVFGPNDRIFSNDGAQSATIEHAHA
jgi:hypothetical protein